MEHFTWRKGGKHLPKAVFDSLGGIENAKKVRRERVEGEKTRRAEASKEAAAAAAAATEGSGVATVTEAGAAVKIEDEQGLSMTQRKRRRADADADDKMAGEEEGGATTALLPIKAERLEVPEGDRVPYRQPGVVWSLA